MQVEFSQLSDTGTRREHNEDYMGYAAPETPELARSRGWLFVLADGVGGQERGEVASRTAVESLLAGFLDAEPGEMHMSLLPRLIQAANTHVHEAAMEPGKRGLTIATTLVACALRFDRAVVGHVGDSRCYLIRSTQVRALTRDHTVANEQVLMGLLSAREAATVRTRHVLSRSLGNDLVVNAEINEHQVMNGDVLLLCSDGLHGAVTPSEMAHIIGHSENLTAAAKKLIEVANQKDGSDNISVQLIRVRGVERIGMYRGRPYKLR
jgi:protein phosphatase